jgi:hypothetical protein
MPGHFGKAERLKAFPTGSWSAFWSTVLTRAYRHIDEAIRCPEIRTDREANHQSLSDQGSFDGRRL